MTKIQGWKSIIHKRKRREYAIPFPILYGETSKSSISKEKNTLARLWTIEKSMDATEGFWKNVLEFSGYVDSKWKSDDELEEFYEKYFPDDIPDEWSLTDQEKSHGKGLGDLERSVIRWLRAWTPPGVTISSTAMKKASSIEWPKGLSIWECLLLQVNFK